MNLIAFTIPEDAAALPAWLEKRLFAPDFARFVAELSAIHSPGGTESAEELLGDWYPHALEEGFAQVPVKRLRKLLRTPACLLGLQEAILIEGSPHWDSVADAEEGFEEAVASGKSALKSVFTASPSPLAEARPPKRVRTFKVWAMSASALAACLLLAVGYLLLPGDDRPRPKFEQVAWGWGKPGGLANDVADRVSYLKALAKSADEWFDARPTGSQAVAQRLTELRAGCSKLILSNYGALPPAEKDWLIAKCKEWARQMDGLLAAVEGGADPVGVRGEADELIHGITKTLRDRAAS